MKKRITVPLLLVAALAIIRVDASAQGRADQGGRPRGPNNRFAAARDMDRSLAAGTVAGSCTDNTQTG